VAADIYGNTISFGGAFKAENSSLTFPGLGQRGAGLLIQSMAVNYVQSISRLWEVGSPAFYYVGGRTQGDFTINRVIGPAVLSQAFYETYGNICNPRPIEFNLQSGFCTPARNSPLGTTPGVISYIMAHTVIMRVGFTIGAQDMLINEQCAGMFGSLQRAQSGGVNRAIPAGLPLAA
jgi:hypothetical protein